MNAVFAHGSVSCPDPLVFTSPEPSCARSELLSICERLAEVWGERAQSELELWRNFKRELAETSNVEQALRAYSENAARRMHMALENAQRIFEEHQAIASQFSRGQDATG